MGGRGGSVRARFLRLVPVAVCAAVTVALTPVVAWAAPAPTFSSEYLKGTLHGQRFAIGVIAAGPQAMIPTSASIKIDGIAVKTTVSTTSFGHWQYSETGPDANGAYRLTSTWVVDAPRKNEVALSASPSSAALVNGTHTVVATVKDVKGSTFTDTWTYTLEAPPATTFGSPSPTVVGPGTSLSNVYLSVAATDPVGIKSATMQVDGLAKTPYVSYAGHWEYNDYEEWFVPDYTQATVGFRMPSLTVGSHAVTVTVTNNSNQTVSKAWTVDVQPARATFNLMSPGPGSTATAWDLPVSVVLGDSAGINDGAVLTVDGIPHTLALKYGYGTEWVTQEEWDYWSYNYYPGPDPLDTTRALASFSPGMLADGAHTASISFTDPTGRSASASWNFSVAAPPELSNLLPADKGSVSTRTPPISVKVADNGPISSTTMSVDGVSVPATYDAVSGILSYTPASPLANDAVHTVSASATDAGGHTTSAAWSFTVQIYADMPRSGTCTDCHDATQHPMSNCNACHGVVYIGHGLGGPVSTCVSCHGSGGHGPEKIIPGVTWGGGDDPQPGYTGYWGNYCDYCHSPSYPSIPRHAGDNAVLHTTTTDMAACNECHVRELTNEHFRYKNAAGAPLDCWTCHGASASDQVKTAIASGNTACDACHTGALHEALHDIAPRVDSCGSCHAGDSLTVVHAAVGCAVCHGTTDPVVIAAVDAGEKACATCHAGADHAALHVVTPRGDTCVSCHAGDNLITLHPTCDTCHASANAAVIAAIATGKKACSACHVTEGVDYHLNMASAHTAPVSDYYSCGHCHHGWGNPMQGPNLTSHTGGCTTCHNSTFDLTGKTATCSSCHVMEGADFHPNMAAYHTATDAGSLACADCHDTTDVRAIHTTQGCQTCHVDYTCQECHAVHGAELPYALRGVRCGKCHATQGVDFHASMTAAHTFAAMPASCQVTGCHVNTLPEAHAGLTGTGSPNPQYSTSCQLCHANQDPNRIPAGATADCSSCHAQADHVVVHDVTPRGDTCVACHAGDNLITLHPTCDTCHASANAAVIAAIATGKKACSACHIAEGADYHLNMASAHAISSSDNQSCGYCHFHHGWTMPSEGAQLTTHPGGCATCHNATLDLTGKTSACASCHVAEGVDYHPTVVTDHTPTDTASLACADCHGTTDVRVVHATSGCRTCHVSDQCAECHSVHGGMGGGYLKKGTKCSVCHATQGVDFHASMTAAHTFAAMPASCQVTGCHVNTLPEAHAGLTGTGSPNPQYSTSCQLCHANQDPNRIPAGATADCSSCHAHIDHNALHDSTVSSAEISISGVSYGTHACSECHTSTNLVAVHTGTCASCHPDPVAAFNLTGGWNKTCVQGGCHTDPASASKPEHGNIDAAHGYPADRGDCLASGCHDAGATVPFEGKDVAAIHASVTTATPDGHTYSSCEICHSLAFSATLTTECLVCHADRAQAHGYDAAAHTASSTCVGTCHTATAGMTELKPLHDAALGVPMACGACHPAAVDAIAPWDKTCTACHPIADLHPAAAASHIGTDVAYRDASFLGNGCTADAGHTEMLSCHTLGNIALLHSSLSSDGCPVCHGAGKTPSQECLDCHQPGESTTYVKPGSLASGNATWYPNGDVSITSGWTYATTPAGQARYAVVNTPYPPADTTRYVTVTSKAAGGMLFGVDRTPAVVIPDNATIVQVNVYSKAKASAYNLRSQQATFRIDGADYTGPMASQKIPNTGFFAGEGQQLPSSSALGYDYTFDMYGMAIYGNPKTGQRWTAKQLKGTDTSGNLEAFGVGLSSSGTTCTVSLAQVHLRVIYYVKDPAVTYPTVGTGTYHHNNVKYLHDPADAGGKSFAVDPAHGWYEALYNQDCYDYCHRGMGVDPLFSAEQGSWMWYSVAGDPSDALTQERYLSLKPVAVPVSSPAFAFQTRYGFAGTDTGTVEISTDGGTTWTALTGTVGGASVNSLTGSSSAWVPASYDLSAYAGQSVKLRFSAGGASVNTVGWAIDEIRITGDGTTVFSDDAETLKPDWTNTWWTRSMSAFGYN